MEITKFIPHRNHMVLIDKIVHNFEDDFTVTVKIHKGSLLACDYGVPSYCGIEYMAQTIAAYSSIYLYKGLKARIGFIISLRNFESKVPYFKFGDTLKINITPVLVTNNSGLFDCTISENNKIVVSAKIMAFVPNESDMEKLQREN